MEAATLIRQSRQRAGLTQTELARRLGTTQSAVARLETPGSSPLLVTLERALQATGHQLDIRARPTRPTVDEAQIRERLELTPAARLAAFQASHARTRRLLEKSKPRP